MKIDFQVNNGDLTGKSSERNRNFFAMASELLADFPQRSQEIIKKRFGLLQEKPQTLEKIGTDYGITRERVRQIITDVTKKISQKKNEPSFKTAAERIILAIEKKNGIIKEQEIMETLSSGDWKEANSVSFFRVCLGKVITVEDSEIKKSWALDKKDVEKAKEVGEIAKEILKKEGDLLKDEGIIKKIAEKRNELSEDEIMNYLKVSARIDKNKFDKWGLIGWMEINPKGTRERIYAVLREKKKPLHFAEIARLIDKYELSKNKAHIQTVHNELIKYEQFVLIGRGVYALKEWGYPEGTIKDVLEDILSKSKKFLTKEEILEKVLKVRQVKKATVLINLSNEEIFVREKNAYSVKKN